MKDLVFKYNQNGVRLTKEYETIMQFVDEIEDDEFDILMSAYCNVEAVFFENNLTKKYFNTIGELYRHCKDIIK